jgi:membrane associated rhomboid family serine protease
VFSFLTPWVKRLIFANVIMFAAQHVIPTDALVFVPAFALYRPWTFVTYMFLHGGTWHLLFNMVSLAFFGPRVEAQMGSPRFIALYFVSGLGGAILSYFTTPAGIIGASGAIFGVELAFAIFWPTDRIFIWGVIPVEARWLVLLTTLYSIWAGLGSYGGGVAHFAHLGGYVGAFLYLRWIDFRSPLRSYQRKLDAAMFGKRGLGLSGDADEIARWEAISRDGLHQMNVEELDRVIGKAKRDGARSLTTDERAFLHRMSLRGTSDQAKPPERGDGSPVSS